MAAMNARPTIPANAGSRSGRICLYGCLALLGALVILSAAGIWAANRTEDAVASLSGDTAPMQVCGLVARFSAGLMSGSIRPETGIQILCRLFSDISDGVLTGEEIWSILEQVRGACEVRL